MSLHVWSSIAMGILTIAHMVLNRKGVARSYRIVGDVPNKAATARPTKRGFAWAGVVLLLTISIVGGYWFAAIDDTHGSGNERQVATAQSSADNVSIRGGGNGNRGR